MFSSFNAISICIKNQNLIWKNWENEDDLNLFLDGPNFMQNEIIIPMLLIRVVILSHSQKGISFNSQNVNIRVLVKALILTSGIFFRSFCGIIIP